MSTVLTRLSSVALESRRDHLHVRDKRKAGAPVSRLSRMSHSTFDSEAALLAEGTKPMRQGILRQHAQQHEASFLIEERLEASPEAGLNGPLRQATRQSSSHLHGPRAREIAHRVAGKHSGQSRSGQGGYGAPTRVPLEHGRDAATQNSIGGGSTRDAPDAGDNLAAQDVHTRGRHGITSRQPVALHGDAGLDEAMHGTQLHHM